MLHFTGGLGECQGLDAEAIHVCAWMTMFKPLAVPASTVQPRTSFTDVMGSEPPASGTVLKSVSPNVAEALGYTPLDFLFVDRQHGSPVTEQLEHLVRVADLAGLPTIVRVPREDTSLITGFLDFGVSGIVLPQIEARAPVREASSHMRYRDGRSLGSFTRAARFGEVPKETYAEHVNERLALLPMIETAAGMEAVEEIAAMPETTAITIGPGDLAWSLGVEFGGPEHHAAITEIFERSAEQDCPVGLFVPSTAEFERNRGRAAFLIYSSDVSILMKHFSEQFGGE